MQKDVKFKIRERFFFLVIVIITPNAAALKMTVPAWQILIFW